MLSCDTRYEGGCREVHVNSKMCCVFGRHGTAGGIYGGWESGVEYGERVAQSRSRGC